MTLEVHRHKNLAPESGVEFNPLAPISEPVSGACVRGLSYPGSGNAKILKIDQDLTEHQLQSNIRCHVFMDH